MWYRDPLPPDRTLQRESNLPGCRGRQQTSFYILIHWKLNAEFTSGVKSSFFLSVSSETFSFVLTEIDGSRRNGYCRRLLVSVWCVGLTLSSQGDVHIVNVLSLSNLQPGGKGARPPEAYCIISSVACFGLFSKVNNSTCVWVSGSLALMRLT